MIDSQIKPAIGTRFLINQSLLMICVFLLWPCAIKGQPHQIGVELGAGPNLNFNRETENYEDSQILLARNWAGLKYYLEGHYSPAPKIRGTLGFSSSTIRVGNSHSTSTYRFYRLYLMPTYSIFIGRHFSGELSLLGGLMFHNHKEYESTRYWPTYVNGNYVGFTQSTYNLLPDRPGNVWFLGSQLGLKYKLGNSNSSLLLNLGASTSTELLVRQYTLDYNVSTGSDYIVIENWGEMMYLTLGYRLTLDLGRKKN